MNLLIRALGRPPKHLSKRSRFLGIAGTGLLTGLATFLVLMTGHDLYSLRGVATLAVAIFIPVYMVRYFQYRFWTEGPE